MSRRVRVLLTALAVVLGLVLPTGVAYAADRSPIVNVDSAVLGDTYFQLSGWAYDPDYAPATVDIEFDDYAPSGAVNVTYYAASDPRADVNAAFGIRGWHGFNWRVPLSEQGDHTVCAFALNIIGTAPATPLGCWEFTFRLTVSAFLDIRRLDGFDYTFSGWAYDPNSPAEPLVIALVVDYTDGTYDEWDFLSDVPRPDVAAAFPGVGGTQGFNETQRLESGGAHQVCLYALAVDDALTNNRELLCETVNTPIPFGSVDSVTNSAVGQLQVGGWSLDPDVPAATVDNHFYVTAPNGAVSGYAGNLGTGSRPDVAAAFPGTGSTHGFSGVVPVSSEGTYKVCVFTISARVPATNPQIGCKSVQVRNAFGAFDSVSQSGSTVTVRGWALNPNTWDPAVEVHVYDFGPTTRGFAGIQANQPRADVGAVFGHGANHGYSFDVTGVTPGTHTFCVYAITTGGGVGNTQIGCKNLNVA